MTDQIEPKKRKTRPPWSDEERRLRAERWAQKKAQKEAAEKENKEEQEKTPKKRGRKPGDGNMNLWKSSPMTRQGFGEKPEDKVLIRRLLGETLRTYRCPKVTSDEELAQRFDEYFRECAENGIIPTVEELEMRTGYSTAWLNGVKNGLIAGFSPETKNIIIRTRQFLKTFDAKLVITGEMNPIVYFFRAKNYYEMKDQQEVTFSGNVQNEHEMSKEELNEWFLEDGKTVETTFKDQD